MTITVRNNYQLNNESRIKVALEAVQGLCLAYPWKMKRNSDCKGIGFRIVTETAEE